MAVEYARYHLSSAGSVLSAINPSASEQSLRKSRPYPKASASLGLGHPLRRRLLLSDSNDLARQSHGRNQQNSRASEVIERCGRSLTTVADGMAGGVERGLWAVRAETLAERRPWHCTGSLIGCIRPPRLLAKRLDDALCRPSHHHHLLLLPNIARFGSSDKMTRASQTISLLVVLFAVRHSLFTLNAS